MSTRLVRAWNGVTSAPINSSKRKLPVFRFALSPQMGCPVLLNLHGGAFNSDSGSYTESIPIAGYCKIKVVAVLFRLKPEHPFRAAIDDSVAVYKELLRTYKSSHIAIYGSLAGTILTAEVAARLKQLGLPFPAALGIFSGMGDFSRVGDSEALYALRGLSGHYYQAHGVNSEYAAAVSWLARGALTLGQTEIAARYLAQTKTLVAALLKTNKAVEDDSFLEARRRVHRGGSAHHCYARPARSGGRFP
jgi:acetyl esterase/lipase